MSRRRIRTIPGVLVLSQFAGAAEQLEEALIVNPHDPASLADRHAARASKCRSASGAPATGRCGAAIADQDVAWWRERFLAALAKASSAASAPGSRRRRALAPRQDG